MVGRRGGGEQEVRCRREMQLDMSPFPGQDELHRLQLCPRFTSDL